MPSNPRSLLKKKTAKTLNHIDKALVMLDELYDVFAPQHADYGELLAAIIMSQITVRGFILDFWAKAWGEAPDDYTRWL
jgi:hypothetical protein